MLVLIKHYLVLSTSEWWRKPEYMEKHPTFRKTIFTLSQTRMDPEWDKNLVFELHGDRLARTLDHPFTNSILEFLN